MKTRLLRSSALEDLRSDVGRNLNRYREGNFAFLEGDPAHWFELDIDTNIERLADLKSPQGDNYFEVENCEALYDAIPALSPYEARDERLWTYLSHTTLLDHARERWPIPDDDVTAARHITKHFFGHDKRQIERDNVASRLWWMAHLCSRIPQLDRRRALEAFLLRSDVRANLIERPTTSQNVAIFGFVLTILDKSRMGKQMLFERENFRRMMREINSIGGYRLLDNLGPAELDSLLGELVAQKLGLSEI